MNKRKKKENLIQLYKELIPDIDATEEQIQFLLKEYRDNKSIIGIHNTFLNYPSFFDTGLQNYTFLNTKTKDLTNTIMYSDMLASLMVYPNGDGKRREGTAIILKIPKKVFTQEQGILETLKDGKYGIPPQFIRAAFYDGKVIENTASYDENYESETADLCENTVKMNDKNFQIKVFKQVYYQKESLWQKWKRKVKLISKNKIKTLDEAKTPISKEEHNSFLEKLKEGAPTLRKQGEFMNQRHENTKESEVDVLQSQKDR